MYFLDINFRENKTVLHELKQVYGIGKSKATMVCHKSGIALNCKFRDLTLEQLAKLSTATTNFKINVDLKQVNRLIRSELIEIKLYRGLRSMKGFPVRGQRTRTNAKTAASFHHKYMLKPLFKKRKY